METWCGAEGTEIDTAGILTTATNDDLKTIHPRMPVIINEENYKLWLNVRQYQGNEILQLLKPADNNQFVIQKISSKVNDSNYRSADLLLPINENKKQKTNGNQLTLF